ncbi:MAG: GNAT family N-acetyltransferase [Anaerolineaceae bacterium]|nr:GNAT family N-acetyltransferase [Anaerolineaceae bacterium]
MKSQGREAEISVRLARKQDVAAIRALIEPHVTSGRLMQRATEEIEYLLPTFVVAEQDGAVIGCAALEVYSSRLAEVRSLAVLDSLQGLGVGRRLVEACIAIARERQVMEVMAITSNEAFFRAVGFDFTLANERKALFIDPQKRP